MGWGSAKNIETWVAILFPSLRKGIDNWEFRFRSGSGLETPRPANIWDPEKALLEDPGYCFVTFGDVETFPRFLSNSHQFYLEVKPGNINELRKVGRLNCDAYTFHKILILRF